MDKDAAERNQIGLLEGLRQVYRHVPSNLRREFLAVLVLMFVSGLAELATIGSVVPFIAFLSNSPTAQLPQLTGLFVRLGEAIGSDSVTAAAIVFAAFAIIAGLVRMTLAWMTQRFIFGLSHHLALEAFRRILCQSYIFHAQRDMAALLSATDKIEILVFDLIFPAMQTLIAAFIATFLIAGLVYIDPATTLATAAAFSLIYFLVSLVTRKRLAANSEVAATGYNERFKIVNESLGGIRDLIIDNAQEMHLDLFDRVNGRLALARANTAFIASSPRFVIESAGTVLIAAIAVVVTGREGGTAAALPFLGALALGAQRLLPLIQTVFTGWSLGSGNRSIIAQVLDLLELPKTGFSDKLPSPLMFGDRISFENVSFSYPSRPGSAALQGLSFTIPAGCIVAITGKTGAGKSTLADLLMALLEPDEGTIRVDTVALTPKNARSWQRNISHVPQSIFLADTTIEANIALGLPGEPIDRQRVIEASRKAQLHDFIESLPQGYDTIIGERGIRLSGGQRQRLGLARAMYKGTPLLVLDEATSALDDATEAAVMGTLGLLAAEGRTIVIIAHRRSTISNCDFVIRLHDGCVAEISTAADIAGLTEPAQPRRRNGRAKRASEAG